MAVFRRRQAIGCSLWLLDILPQGGIPRMRDGILDISHSLPLIFPWILDILPQGGIPRMRDAILDILFLLPISCFVWRCAR
jgi:hypothetical protein